MGCRHSCVVDVIGHVNHVTTYLLGSGSRHQLRSTGAIENLTGPKRCGEFDHDIRGLCHGVAHPTGIVRRIGDEDDDILI